MFRDLGCTWSPGLGIYVMSSSWDVLVQESLVMEVKSCGLGRGLDGGHMQRPGLGRFRGYDSILV